MIGKPFGLLAKAVSEQPFRGLDDVRVDGAAALVQ